MRCSQIIEKMAEIVEHDGDKEGYINADGVPVKVTEVILYAASEIDVEDPVVIIR